MEKNHHSATYDTGGERKVLLPAKSESDADAIEDSGIGRLDR